MNQERLAQIHDLCRDEAAFEQLQQTLSAELHSLEEIREAQLQVERQKTLLRVVTRLRETLDLDTLFKATAAEVRQLLSADRVGMFRFYPDSGWDDGEFVSEDVDPEFSSAIAQKIHDHCFGDQFAVHYQEGRVQNVADIYSAGLSDCHIQILAQFQVRANLVVPLLQGKHLWGLLCIHQCRDSREWQTTEIEFVQQIASHLAIALQQAELMAELRAEIAERQQAQERAQEFNQGLRQAIVELQAVNQELETFSYSVSHDLRAPLRSIDGFSQALLEDYLEHLDTTGQDYLRRIRSASQRMGQLIDDLLTLSRVTRSEMQKQTVNLSHVASRLCTQLQQAHPERQVEFVIQPELIANGDPHLLQVVLDNLISNAWKFTSREPLARIEFGGMIQENGIPIYFVQDNGVGFEMAFVEKLFKPFQRLHQMQEFPGNGIGLATVQRIIHRHGGQVWAEGKLNQGTTFYFTLAAEEISA
ncbi:sensor histidine kinase [Leptolyngbya ohadii]|uniref:sensor histidine kinase n=1 Tax=Leptolyngbya ohadii TaxID=1962290 RepID=UPI000B5A1745|nr:GAF domain-containing protein [Leptolyngbya ohadii]